MAYFHTSPLGDAVQDCQLSCYDSKSAEYDTCRGLPPEEQVIRKTCFELADNNLRECLGKCPQPGKMGVGVGGAVAAAAIAALLLR